MKIGELESIAQLLEIFPLIIIKWVRIRPYLQLSMRWWLQRDSNKYHERTIVWNHIPASLYIFCGRYNAYIDWKVGNVSFVSIVTNHVCVVTETFPVLRLENTSKWVLAVVVQQPTSGNWFVSLHSAFNWKTF